MKALFKMLRRALLLLFLLLLGLMAFLALSIPIDRWLSRDAVAELSNQSIAAGTSTLAAYVAKPEGEGPFPAVIMIHEFWGLRPSLLGKADLLAKEGYVVIAPDVMRGKSTSWLPSAIYQTIRAKPEAINSDLDNVYTWLEQQPYIDTTRVAMMGFCFGGGATLRYSLENTKLSAAAMFYGSLILEPERLENLTMPLLGIFGEDDASIPAQDVRAFDAMLTTLDVEHQISLYANKGHAFVESAEGIASDPVQAKAWQELKDFLAQYLAIKS